MSSPHQMSQRIDLLFICILFQELNISTKTLFCVFYYMFDEHFQTDFLFEHVSIGDRVAGKWGNWKLYQD